MKTLFLFDFDGVLIRSENELAITAYNSTRKSDQLIKTFEALPEFYQSSFLQNHYQARNAGEIHLLAEWALSQSEISFSDFRSQLTSSEGSDKDSLLKEKGKLFFQTRQELLNHHSDNWCRLSLPINPLWDLVGKLPPSSFYIVTNKNFDAVKTLCNYYSLEIPEEHIFSNDRGLTKLERIERIEGTCSPEISYFIDDSFRNLLEVSAGNSPDHRKLHHATWAIPETARTAQTHPNIFPMSLEGCTSLIEKTLNEISA